METPRNPEQAPAAVENNKDGIPSPEEIIGELERAEKRMDELTERAMRPDDEEITSRLRSLGAKPEEIAEAIEKANEIRARIEAINHYHNENLGESLIRTYEENFQRMDLALISEIKMRPISNRCDKIYKSLQKKGDYGFRETTNLGPHFSGNPSRMSIAARYGLDRKTIVKNIETYSKYHPSRKYNTLLKFLPDTSHVAEYKDLNLLYSYLLSNIKEDLEKDVLSQEQIKAYFLPGVDVYIDDHHHRTKNKNRANEAWSAKVPSITVRIALLNDCLDNSESSLSNELKALLRQELLNTLETHPDDFTAEASEQHNKLIKFISRIGFSEEQRNLIFERLALGAMKSRFSMDRIHSMSETVSTPNGRIMLLDYLKQIDKKYFLQEMRDGKMIQLIQQKLTSEQKKDIGRISFERLVDNLKTVEADGNFRYLINISNNKNFEYNESGFLEPEQLTEYISVAKLLITGAVKKYLERLDMSHQTNTDAFAELQECIDFLKQLPEDQTEEVEELIRQKTSWTDSIERMTNIQKRSRRREYDPWLTDISPLATNAIRNKTLDIQNPKDGEILYEYLNMVGAKNLPIYFRVFSEIKRCNSLEDISEDLRNRIKAYFNIDVAEVCKNDPRNVSLIIKEMESYRKNFIKELVEEKEEVLETILNSEVGSELLNSAVGKSNFGRGGTNKEVLTAYKEAKLKKPEAFSLPTGYEPTNIELKEFSSVEDGDLSEEKQKEIDAILINPDLVKYYSKIFEAWKSIKSDKSASEIANGYSIRAISEFEKEEDDIRQKITSEQQKADKNEKALINLEKRLSQLTIQKTQFMEFSRTESNSVLFLMEQFQRLIPDNYATKEKLMLELSLRDIKEKFKDQIEALNKGNAVSLSPDVNNIGPLAEFIKSHVGAHYLDKKHGEEQAIATKEKDLIKYLRKAWGSQDFDKSILEISRKKLELLERGESTGKTRNLSLIPSKGIQRIFSGDLGNACTSRQGLKLAKGEFPNIVSYSLVLDMGTAKEKFAGSFLVIETKTKENDSILVLRANNPSQSLVTMTDPEELIQKIIEEVKRVAERRNIKHVALAYTSGAASNRSFVTDYYRKLYTEEQQTQLVKNDETTFNGYSIHHKGGTILIK